MRTTRGYALLIVLVLSTAIAAVAGALLISVARDTVGARKQANVLRSLYAAESAVAFGVDAVRQTIAVNPSPTSADLAAISAPVLPDVSFEQYRISYIEPSTLATRTTPALSVQPMTSGPFQGMIAQRSPIEVFATPVLSGARASLSDYVNLDLIPVYQFAVFADQEVEYLWPEPSTISGRLHSNTNIFFGDGANNITFVNAVVTTAGRIQLRDSQGTSSTTGSRQPLINGVSLPCDNAATGRVSCPGTADWLAYTSASFSAARDVAHGVEKIHLPTGISETAFTRVVNSTPDLCGDNASGVRVQGAGIGRQLSPDWLSIDLPRTGDSAALTTVKFAHTAGLRVIDGVWQQRTASGAYNPLFRQDTPSDSRTQCVYYGYNPSTGTALANSDGIPAIRDARFWDYQDRKMRRVQIVDMHRLTRCVPELEQAGFNGIIYFGEDTAASVDNWGLNPDAKFYQLTSGSCSTDFLRLPNYLRGQFSSVAGVGTKPADMPAYLFNDDVNSAAPVPVLDNPYYPAAGFCVPGLTPGDPRGLGDGPYRLPQGDGDGVLEPGRNELVESGFLIRNAQRLPNVVVSGRDQGFTFATNMPVYLQGDVNVVKGPFSAARTGYTNGKIPVSVVSDAVTFLSDQYNDLQENPFAPVGPLAVWQGVHSDNNEPGGNVVDAQSTPGSPRHWSMLDLGRPNNATTPPATNATRFDTDFDNAAGSPDTFDPSSPAPCVNLLRELVMRRRVAPTAGLLSANCTGSCGLDAVSSQSAATTLEFGRDWFTDLRAAGAARLKASSQTGADDLMPTAGVEPRPTIEWLRANNALVAFAPLEDFLDVSMYLTINPATAGFSSFAIPSQRNNREALRDWMRCTLDSGHHLADDGSANSLVYTGRTPNTAQAVLMGAQPQAVALGTARATREAGMRAATNDSANADVTFVRILGHDGFAPFSMAGDADFTSGGNVLFTRDRSSLSDSNGQGSPSAIESNLSNLTAAAAGDQLALNVNLLTGTTWMCPQGPPYPTTGANNFINASMANGSANTWWNQFNGSDEGLYGIFRYQENWFQINGGGGQYIDFFINGSTVVMFNSVESTGRHILNQGFMNNMIAPSAGCGGGNDNGHTGQSRQCRLASGYEYAWESSRRAITYDTDNNDPAKLPPGTPRVLSTSRIRWVRR